MKCKSCRAAIVPNKNEAIRCDGCLKTGCDACIDFHKVDRALLVMCKSCRKKNK
jgi:hypothetical protein